MSYKSILSFFLLCSAFTLIGQSQTQDSINLKSLMTYSEEELAIKVDQVYNSLDLKDSLSIYELYENLEFGKIYDQINLDTIIARVDWDEVLQNFDWNQLLQDFDWNQMFDDLCQSKDSLLSQPQISSMQGSSMMAMPNIANCMSISMQKSMQAMDMTCIMQKMTSGEISMDMFSLEGMCEMATCMDLSVMYEDTDWNCVFEQFDMDEYMRQYDFKSLLKNYDSLQTKDYLPSMNQQIRNHPILHQLNPDSLFKLTKASPAELFSIPEISVVYQNLYQNLVDSRFQESLAQSESYLKSNLELFAAFMNNYFDDPEAIKYYVTYSWLLYEMNLNTQNFQFAQAYEQQLVLKDLLIYAIEHNLFDVLNNDEIEVRKIIGENFEWENLAGLYQNIGYTLTQMGQFQEAIHQFEQGIELREHLTAELATPYVISDFLQFAYPDSSHRQTMMDNLGISEEAFDIYQMMLINGQHPPLIHSLLAEKKYTEAIESYQVFKDLLLARNEANNIRPGFIIENRLLDKVYGLKIMKGIYRNMAAIEAQNPNGNKTITEKYQAATKVLDKFVHQQNMVISHHEMGNTYKLMRNFEKSLASYNQAWTLLKTIENLDYLVWVLPGVGDFEKDYLNKLTLHVAVIVNISNLHSARKDYSAASHFLEQSLDYLEKVHEKEIQSPAKAKVLNYERDLFPVYANLGKIYLLQNESTRADYYFQKCKNISTTWQQPLIIYHNAFNLGEYYQYLQQPDSAFYYYKLAAQQAKTLDFEQGLANTYFRQGLLHQLKNEPKLALSYYDSCETIAKELSLYDLRSAVQTLRGYLTKKEGKQLQALTHFKNAIEIIENDIFSNVFGEQSRQLALENSFNAYAGAVSTALLLERKEEAFQFVQQAKSRTFNDLLALIHTDTTKEMQVLNVQIDSLLLRMDKNQNKLVEVKSEEQRDSIRNSQKQLLRQLEIIKSEIISLNRDYLPMSKTNIASIKQLMKPQQAFIEYFHGDSTYAFVITNQGFKVFTLGASIEITKKMQNLKVLTDEVKKSLTSFLHRKASIEKYWNPKGELYSILSTTYHTLFAPIKNDPILKDIKELVIAPDADLYYLPFEMMIAENEEEEWGNYPYLIDDYSTGYSQSATTFYQNSIKKKNQPFNTYETDLLFIGVTDFRYSNLESLELPEINFSEINDNQTVYLVQEEATFDNFMNLNFNIYKTIYISTHGIIDPVIPELSYLALKDKPLSLYYLNKLNIKCETMILSACQTGRGRFYRGSGLKGFTRELMTAGAKSLIISLWSVEEQSTAQLFEPYFKMSNPTIDAYQMLHNQKIALKKAKQPMELYDRQGELIINSAHPFFWASFVYFGTP